jgi:hypothetical protein
VRLNLPMLEQISLDHDRLAQCRFASSHHWLHPWYDHRGRLVETLIPRILASFQELALRLKAERLYQDAATPSRDDRKY